MHLHPTERVPTHRKVDTNFSEDPIMIKDMPDMAQLVYDIYMDKMAIFKKEEDEKREVISRI